MTAVPHWTHQRPDSWLASGFKVMCAYMCMCRSCAWQCSTRGDQQRAGVTGRCEPPYMCCWKPNSGPLCEQCSLWTAELSHLYVLPFSRAEDIFSEGGKRFPFCNIAYDILWYSSITVITLCICHNLAIISSGPRAVKLLPTECKLTFHVKTIITRCNTSPRHLLGDVESISHHWGEWMFI